MPESVDVPELYYVWSTLHGIRFMFDIEEGQRIANELAKHAEDTIDKASAFLRAKTYSGAPALLAVHLCNAFWLSTPEERAMDDAWEKRDNQRENFS